MKNQFRNRHLWWLYPQHGLIVDLADDQYPSLIWGLGWQGQQKLSLPDGMTHFGFLYQGGAILERDGGPVKQFELGEGMFFACPERCQIRPGRGAKGLVVSRIGYTGLFQVGGPIESVGRYNYMNGASATLLAWPVKLGDPCTNHLHFPANCDQARHDHQSFRLNLVVAGQGWCVVPAGDDSDSPDQALFIQPGSLFLVPRGGQHANRTEGCPLDLFTYHPNTVIGFDNDCHPMLDGTFVKGRSIGQSSELTNRSDR